MRDMRDRCRRGFTLIEVLIVVTIMAILAATIIPQFTTSADEARNSQRDFNVHLLRSQVEVYRLQHTSTYPDPLSLLTQKTDIDGTVNPTAAFGPYIVGGALPLNPITGSNTVAASTTGTEALGGGWLYDKATGNIWPDSPLPPGP